MKVKTITLTLDARFDAEGMAKDFLRHYPELIAYIVKGPFEVKDLQAEGRR